MKSFSRGSSAKSNGGLGRRQKLPFNPLPEPKAIEKSESKGVRKIYTGREDIKGIAVRDVVGFSGPPQRYTLGQDITGIVAPYLRFIQAGHIQFKAQCKILIYWNNFPFMWILPNRQVEIIIDPRKTISLLGILEEPAENSQELIAAGAYAGPAVITGPWIGPNTTDEITPVSMVTTGALGPGLSASYEILGRRASRPLSVFRMASGAWPLLPGGSAANSVRTILSSTPIDHEISCIVTVAAGTTLTVEEWNAFFGPGKCDFDEKQFGRIPKPDDVAVPRTTTSSPAQIETYSDAGRIVRSTSL